MVLTQEVAEKEEKVSLIPIRDRPGNSVRGELRKKKIVVLGFLLPGREFLSIPRYLLHFD